MAEQGPIVFCTGGGCTAKLGAGVLSRILEKLPRGEKDPDLLVGYDSRDDAAVYRITEEIALVQTVDFFPPMVDDPYTFGQIAAANALSDVYAMGGEVKTALNLVCFPESMDLNVLGEILRGGAEKVAEAGGTLAGGHSIADTGVKYGLSVTGLVDPHRLTANDTGRPGDKLLLTKALGVGLICTANRVGEAAPEQMEAAVRSMTTLNKTAAEIARRYEVHAATDVTGFSFLGHLHEMMGEKLSCVIDAHAVPVLPGAWEAADACTPPPVSATVIIPGPLSGLRKCPSRWKKSCLIPRPPAACCLPWPRRMPLPWKQSCRRRVCPQRLWAPLGKSRHRRSQ